MKRFLTALLLFTGILQNITAQTTQLRFDHITEKEGLPDPIINFIKQDDLGYIWIGTTSGLARYDGYHLKRYIIDKTQPDAQFNSMISGANHNLWFGDSGYGFKRYNRETDNFTVFSYPAPDNKHYDVQEINLMDRQGNIWGRVGNFIDHATRVVKFDTLHKRYTFFNESAVVSGSNFPVTCLGKDQDATVWMGSDSGLYRYSYTDKKFHYFAFGGSLNGYQAIRSIISPSTEPGILWLNIFDRLSKRMVIGRLDIHDKKVKYYSHTSHPGLTTANDTINTAYEDRRHRIWFGTQNGLLHYDAASETFTCFISRDADKASGGNSIQEIAEGKDGTLWLRTWSGFLSGHGLLKFNPNKNVFERYTSKPTDPAGLSSNFITALLVDRAGLLWAGNYQYAVDKLNPVTSIFNTYPINVRDGTAYSAGITNNIAAAPDGTFLFTNDDGVFKWRPGPGKPERVYKRKQSDGGLDAILPARDGKIYFGNAHGLQVYDPKKRSIESYSSKKNDSTSISGNEIDNLFYDHNGLLWIGTQFKGLCSFNPMTKRFRRYPYIGNDGTRESGHKLDNQIVTAIYEDRAGTLWIGTAYGGLNRFDRHTGNFKSYLMSGPLPTHTIDQIFEDEQGRFWVGTFTLGLFEFDRQTGRYIRHFTENDGLLDNMVGGISQDKDGFLLVSSPRGVTRIDPVSLKMKTFPMNKILPGKSLLQTGNILRSGNQMLLVLTSGISVFDPSELTGNAVPPIVHVEKVEHGDPASTTDSLTTNIAYGTHQLALPHNQNRIVFNYVALHFADPSQNVYSYRLDGYDNHWIRAGTQRLATYTNLPPGTYTFRVKAANSDGVWNNKGDSFTIIINPPWWQTWWAWVIWIVLFVSAVYSFIAYRSRKLIHDKKMLEHKVHIRTEEVMQQKEEIEAQRDSLEQTLGELKTTQNQLIQSEKMASLGELTAGIAHEIQNPLNFVNNFSDVNREMLVELQQELDKGDIKEARAIAIDIEQNEQKINHHGRRADAIVKGMLQHSKTGSGTKEPTNINALADEYLRLAYHGLRSKEKDFNAELVTDFDDKLLRVNVIPQDIGRVLLNLFNNAFYAVNQKQKTMGADYKPEVSVTTSTVDGHVIIKVKDNGIGIPEAIKEKIMQPFFTTKPTGEGTGLGLSLTYDIVVKGHGGGIQIDSVEGDGSEFTIQLPITH